MVREWCVLYILTWKCASRHNGVQFCIAPLASWLRTRRFSEPTFRPSGATNHWKNTVFRDFPTFSRICIFCLLTLSLLIFSLLIFLFSLPLPCSAFHLSILSEVWLLNFLRLNCLSFCLSSHSSIHLLPNVLRATTPYTFSTSQRPKVLRDRQFLTLFTSLCVYLCIFSSVKFSLHLSFDLPLDLSINLSSRHVDNKTMLLDFCYASVVQHQKRSNLRDFLTFCSWKHQKRSNSARLPSKMESALYSWPCTNAFCDFSMPCL